MSFSQISLRVGVSAPNSIQHYIYILLIIATQWPLLASARIVQIVHTNDLHSHFEHASEATRGGYTHVKAKSDEILARARRANYATLRLDGGDFSEGSLEFFSNGGMNAFRMLNHMGMNAVALGNHDFLMGAPHLLKILKTLQLNTPILSANFYCPDLPEMSLYIKPYIQIVDTQMGHPIRIAILGLTTNDTNYSWRVSPHCEIKDPIEEARRLIPTLRVHNDAVIVVSHLGINQDAELASHVNGIDIIVGGHSHTALQHERTVRAPNGKPVTIVQAGQHGEYVGNLLVDIEPGHPVQVLRYRLEEVHHTSPPAHDHHIAAEIDDTKRGLEQLYTPEWLDHVVGHSDVPLDTGIFATTEWGDFVAASMLNASGAEIAVHAGRFDGITHPAGPITRRSLMSIYPRQFEVEKQFGWTVWTCDSPVFFIVSALQSMMEVGMSFNVAGFEPVITYDSRTRRYTIVNIRYRGRILDPYDRLRVAIPEGIVRGALATIPVVSASLIATSLDTRVPVWTALENEFTRRGRVLRPFPKGHRPIFFNPDNGNEFTLGLHWPTPIR